MEKGQLSLVVIQASAARLQYFTQWKALQA
jgi:hypothetical protein